MPRGNGMGPRGMGAMSGRGAGYFAGFNQPGFQNPAAWTANRMGGGGGCRRGWCNTFFATRMPGWMRFVGGSTPPVGKADPEIEKQVLRAQADHLQSEADSIRRRLEELDRQGAES